MIPHQRRRMHVLDSDIIMWTWGGVSSAAKDNGKRPNNYQRIAEAKQRATAVRAKALRGTITETAHPRCCRRAEPARHHDGKRQVMGTRCRALCAPSSRSL
jgi:hypothetical protein